MSIFDIFTKETLLKQVVTEIDQMFNKNKKMFESVTNFLFEGKEVKLDIGKEDKKLNVFEIQIRKKVFEHLSMNPKKDLAFSLIIIDVARDIERVGDFSKNIFNLVSKNKPFKTDNKYWKTLQEVKNYVSESIEKTHKAFSESDQDLANATISNYRELVNQKLTQLTDDISKNDSLNSKDVIVLILISRFLRRITAHLININTSVVNEFPKMRYTKNYSDV